MTGKGIRHGLVLDVQSDPTHGDRARGREVGASHVLVARPINLRPAGTRRQPRRASRTPSATGFPESQCYSLSSTTAGGAGDLGPGFESVQGRQMPGGSCNT